MKFLKSKAGAQRTLRLALALLAVFALGFAAGAVAENRINADSRNVSAIAVLQEAYGMIESRYIDPVEPETLVDGALAGMAEALGDAHSGYIRPELYQRSVNFTGEFTGIGVFASIDEATGDFFIDSVIANSPAASAGLMPGDVFHAVDGALVAGYSHAELSILMLGPPGSPVTISFRRAGDLLTVDIIRQTMPIPNLSYALVGDDIAHVAMLDFNDLSRQQFDEALSALDINQTGGLIFDLRGNAGGTLASAIEIASAFIKDGALLRQVGRDQSEEVTRATGSFANIQKPVVLLVDETSASAAEVLAGALQDHGAAAIIGDRTFGKGTVQNIRPLSNGGGLRLTTRRWLTPNGAWIHGLGIEPDIVVERDAEAAEDGEADPLLEAAIAFLKSLRG